MIEEVLVLDEHDQEVSDGQVIRSFRGDSGTFQGVTRMPELGRSGKVLVDGREYYDKAWNLTLLPLCINGCGGVATVGTLCESCDDVAGT
jgi:hypothetical protein